jgi:hypothetical protein
MKVTIDGVEHEVLTEIQFTNEVEGESILVTITPEGIAVEDEEERNVYWGTWGDFRNDLFNTLFNAE